MKKLSKAAAHLDSRSKTQRPIEVDPRDEAVWIGKFGWLRGNGANRASIRLTSGKVDPAFLTWVLEQ